MSKTSRNTTLIPAALLLLTFTSAAAAFGQGTEASRAAPPIVAPVAVANGSDMASERIQPPASNSNSQYMSVPINTSKLRQRRLETVVRNLLAQTGFPDTGLQDAVIAHITDEDRARNPLREKGEQLFAALQSPRVGDGDIDQLLKDFEKALDDDRSRRTDTEAGLDAKINFSNNSRLQSVLLLFGIIGDGALFVPLREPSRPLTSAAIVSHAPVAPSDQNAQSCLAAPQKVEPPAIAAPSPYDAPVPNVNK